MSKSTTEMKNNKKLTKKQRDNQNEKIKKKKCKLNKTLKILERSKIGKREIQEDAHHKTTKHSAYIYD